MPNIGYANQYQAAAAPSGAQIGINPGDYQGILNEYAAYQNDPYYAGWKADLDAGKLTGQSGWFFDKWKQQKQGDEAIAKQAEVAKQLAAAQYGKAAEGVQSGMTEAGLAKSGFTGEQLGDLAAQENMAFSDIFSRMQDMQQTHRQGLEERWRDERYMKKGENEAKKNRKIQIASEGLQTAGKLLMLA